MNDPFLSTWLIGSGIIIISGPIVTAIQKARGKWNCVDDYIPFLVLWLVLSIGWVVLIPAAIIAGLIFAPIYGIYRLTFWISTKVIQKKQSLKTEQLNYRKDDKIL